MRTCLSLLATTCLSIAAISPAMAEEGTGPVSFPAMAGPLALSDSPATFEAGPVGNITIGGALTGLAFVQNNEVAGDDDNKLDLSNGMVFIQKNEGLVQFYAQAGGYSFPVVGTAYGEADSTTDDLFGLVPVAYASIVPNDNFSISAGKLPTLIGAEYAYTFQNANIQRGLLWNQENVVNRGVQLDYSEGPISAAISLNDGFYSEEYEWVSGLLSYTIDDNSSVSFSGGGNFGDNQDTSSATPLLQNNSQIYTLGYAYSADNWSVAPYVQYTYVPEETSIGINDSASTLGGAVLGTYNIDDQISVSGRAEYITSNGQQSLLYGNESSAWSLTVTPTYREDIFFARAEASYVGLEDATVGAGFGNNGTEDGQGRLLVEVGFVF